MSTAFLDAHGAQETVARLKRVEGQVRGLQRMIEEGRDCVEVIQQLAAARAALDRAGNEIVTAGLRGCLAGVEIDGDTMNHIEAGLRALSSLRG